MNHIARRQPRPTSTQAGSIGHVGAGAMDCPRCGSPDLSAASPIIYDVSAFAFSWLHCDSCGHISAAMTPAGPSINAAVH
jgi:hypothetical protein